MTVPIFTIDLKDDFIDSKIYNEAFFNCKLMSERDTKCLKDGFGSQFRLACFLPENTLTSTCYLPLPFFIVFRMIYPPLSYFSFNFRSFHWVVFNHIFLRFAMDDPVRGIFIQCQPVLISIANYIIFRYAVSHSKFVCSNLAILILYNFP